MFEHERFSYNLARSARAEEFREDHEQMDRQGKQIAHELETILPANLHKTAPRWRFISCQICQFATHRAERPDLTRLAGSVSRRRRQRDGEKLGGQKMRPLVQRQCSGLSARRQMQIGLLKELAILAR
jgi:hypothetical protein